MKKFLNFVILSRREHERQREITKQLRYEIIRLRAIEAKYIALTEGAQARKEGGDA